MKKVLFTATVDSHILQFHIPYLKMFKEKGYEVHVATNGTEKIPYCDVKHIISFERSPIKINNIKAIKNLREIIDKENFDIIHCHTPMGSVVTRIAAKKARKKGTRVIYTAHGFHFFKGAPLLNWIIFFPIERYLARYTDCLITINQEDYDLAKNKFKTKQIELIHGVGVDEIKFNFKMSEKEKHELRESLGLKDDDFVLIQVGELNKNKNQIMAINAMRDLVKENENIHLLLVGNGNLENFYREKIKAYKLENNVDMLGYRDDVPQLIKISNVLLSLSYREGLPVNVIEGMMSGLPIIATDCRGNRDLIENPIQINNIKELKEQILKSYKQEEKCNYIFEDYLEDYVVDKMKKIYDDVAKKKIMHLLASNSYSGAENVACQIINMFKKENDYTMYYCSPDGDIKKELEQKKIMYIPLKKVTRKNVAKIVKEYQIDIIHAHDLKASVIACLLRNSVKVISHIHGNHVFMRKMTLKSIIYNICSLNYSHIYWVSKSSFENYVFKEKIKEKSSILYNVIDEDEIKVKTLQIQKDKQYDIVFIGRLSEPKNPGKLIDVINKIVSMKSDLKCAIIGKGELEEFVLKKIKNMNLSNNVELLGYLSNPFPILSNSKILLMTSTHEGLPMIALESLSLGIPIVSTPTDGISEIVNEKMGFLAEEDEKLAIEAYKIITDDKLRKNISEECKKAFKEINNIKDYKRNLEVNY